MGSFGVVLALLVLGAAGNLLVPNQATEQQVSVHGKKHFSLELAPAHPDGRQSIAYERKRMYRDSGWEPPEGLKRAVKTETKEQQDKPQDSLPFKPAKGKAEFVVKAQVGKHTMWLEVATGSSEL